MTALLALAAAVSGPTIDQPMPLETFPLDERAIYEKQKREREEKNWSYVKPVAIATELAHLADIYTTIKCGKPNNNCVEKWNPHIYGREPKAKRVLAVKLPIMVASWFLGKEASKKSPVAGYVFYGISGVVTGSAVVGNVRILW